MQLTIKKPPLSILSIVTKLMEDKAREEGEEYEYIPIEPLECKGAGGPWKHSALKRGEEPFASALCGYDRRCAPNFSKVAKPDNKLLQDLEGTPSQKKKFRVYWGLEQQKTFETMQRLCTESPILAYADFKAPFVLHTDASGDGLGAVLYQAQGGQKRLIAYASQSLSRSERNYSVHKLEFLALKWAITNKFHEYLYGSEFQLYTVVY